MIDFFNQKLAKRRETLAIIDSTYLTYDFGASEKKLLKKEFTKA